MAGKKLWRPNFLYAAKHAGQWIVIVKFRSEEVEMAVLGQAFKIRVSTDLIGRPEPGKFHLLIAVSQNVILQPLSTQVDRAIALLFPAIR